MAFYDNFIRLCVEKGVTPTFAILDMGLNRSANTAWKNGSVPLSTTLVKVADYFGVDEKELLVGEYKPNNFEMIGKVSILSEDERNLIDAWRECDYETREEVAFLMRKTGFTYTRPNK